MDSVYQYIEKRVMRMFERIEYQVVSLEGDYAYLKNLTMDTGELKCVVPALLAEGTNGKSITIIFTTTHKDTIDLGKWYI